MSESDISIIASWLPNRRIWLTCWTSGAADGYDVEDKKTRSHEIAGVDEMATPIAERSGHIAVNLIGELLSPEYVLLDLDVSSKQSLFEEVGRLLEQKLGLEQALVVKSLCAREQLGSTGLGHGVAFPHARIKGLPQAIAAFVRTALPIAFDAPDEEPVSEMLVLLVPEQATKQHLQILASAAKMFGDRAFRERLRMCADVDAVRQLFADWPRP